VVQRWVSEQINPGLSLWLDEKRGSRQGLYSFALTVPAVPICVRLVGAARAKQMIMTGKLFDAVTL
jgi:hypothetical protein